MRIFLLAALTLGTFASAMAHFEIFEGTLSGLQENPPNASPGTGFARVTLDLDLYTMRVEAMFSGLTGTTTASHIHIGNGPGTNGGVATQLPSFVGFPLGVTSGSYDHTFDMALASTWNPSYVTANGGTVATASATFITKLEEGKGYLNIHTSTFGGGEIRANLVMVPEPFTVTALGLGVAALVARRRRRTR